MDDFLLTWLKDKEKEKEFESGRNNVTELRSGEMSFILSFRKKLRTAAIALLSIIIFGYIFIICLFFKR